MTEITIDKNVVARVHYTGTLPDTGEVFDSSEGRDPLAFLVGHGKMIPGFEEEMMGASQGERREFTLEPERAYGHPLEDLITDFPKDQFAQLEQSGVEIEVGMTLVAQWLAKHSVFPSKWLRFAKPRKKKLVMVMHTAPVA